MRAALLLHAALAATLISAPDARAQSATASDLPAWRIDGRVVTPYAELLSDATVTLGSATGSGESRTTTTSASGTFAFGNVPPGEYVLTASKTGYTDREVVASHVPAAREVRVQDGDLGDVELTMRRSGSIAGRIVKPDGTPAPGTDVMVALRNGAVLSMLPEFRTTSEWDGRYQLTGLPPGEFHVIVLPPRPDPPPLAAALPVDVSSAPLRFEPTLYPGVAQSEPGGTIVVYEGVATEGIDVWLMPAPQRFTVSGRVFWPEGLEVESIALDYGGSPDVRSGVWYIDDPGGLFTLEGISRGALLLLARAESNRGPLIGLAATDVLVGPVEEVRLDLAPPGSVSGRLVSERPLPSDAQPRVSLTHTLLTVSALFPGEDSAVAADGRFHIPHARGAYVLDVHGLPAGWRLRQVRRHGIPLTEGRVIVGSGEQVSDIEISVGP